MSSRLTRNVRGLARAALVVASVVLMLALLPSVAEAQSDDRDASSTVVVRPGDNLWSIASDRLGPNADPRQIAREVERIHELNRSRIGADPGLIFPAQELSLPPTRQPSTTEAPPAATSAEGGGEDPAASPTVSGDKLDTERISSKAVGEAGGKSGSARDPAELPPALPKLPAEQVTPPVGLPSDTGSPSPLELFARPVSSRLSWAISAVVGLFPQDDLLFGRRLLGLGIIGLTVLVTALMLWKLPMKRSTRFDELWVGTMVRPVAYASYFNFPPPQDDPHRRRGTPRRTPKPEEVESGWIPSVQLEDSLRGIPLQEPLIPLQEPLIPLEHVTEIKNHTEVALEELARLDERRGLFDRERRVEAVLKNLLGKLSAMEKAHG